MILTKKQALKWMRQELSLNSDDYLDCGEIQCTQIAENFCEDHGWQRERIPEFVFDASAEVADEWENQA